MHASLVALGAKWFKKQGFPVIVTEMQAIGSREQADVIAFRSTCSAIIEAKASRSDFLADAKKPERQSEGFGLGVYRFYLCPQDLIGPEDLPPKWGLLHANGNQVIEVVRPKGNIWPSHGMALPGWVEFQNTSNITAERAVLFSIARRLSK